MRYLTHLVPFKHHPCRTGLFGMEVMHERNAHKFPLDLASGEQAPVALIAPAING
jgi:photosystem II P680 reaction center D1 protein